MIWCWAGPIESVALKLCVKIPCDTWVICGCIEGSTSLAKWHNDAQDCWKLKNESVCEVHGRVFVWSRGTSLSGWSRGRILSGWSEQVSVCAVFLGMLVCTARRRLLCCCGTSWSACSHCTLNSSSGCSMCWRRRGASSCTLTNRNGKCWVRPLLSSPSSPTETLSALKSDLKTFLFPKL